MHDILKKEADHADKGAAFLEERGFPEAAKLVRVHMDLPSTASLEAEILYLVDKYVNETEIEPLEIRKKHALGKFSTCDPAKLSALRRMETALEIERKIETMTGVSLLEYLRKC